jgi:glycosyltransferase involved in cell wall biosynthesis
MNKEPLVSVVIPTHNRAAMLRRAIKSVLTQTIEDIDLIVVSDGSIDDTQEVLESIEDQRLCFINHDTGKGAAAARNTGIRASTGKYVAFLDDDDEWLPTKLERQLLIMENAASEVGLVYHWMEYVREGQVLTTRKPTLRGYIFPEMLDKQAITNSSTLLLKREVFEVVNGFDETLWRGNDSDFIRCVTKYFHVDYVPEVLCKVHVGHNDRITIKNQQGIRNELAGLKNWLDKFASDFARYPDKKAYILSRIMKDHIKLGEVKQSFPFFWEALRTYPTMRDKIRFMWKLSYAFTRYAKDREYMKLGSHTDDAEVVR